MNREKRFVNISVHKSNIKNGKGAYYAKVCNTGNVSRVALLQKLKERAPYMDVGMVSLAMDMLSEIVLEEVEKGARVEFFSFGAFSLSAKGAVEMESGMEKTSTCCIKKAPSFHIKFEESNGARALKNMSVSMAIKRCRAPSIEKVENATPKSALGNASLIRVRGEDLKVSGSRGEVGAYIIEESGQKTKIEVVNILENTPKTLLILLEKKLEIGREYTLHLATQYVKMGASRTTSLLRISSHRFVWAEAGKSKQHIEPEKLKNIAKYLRQY